MVNALSRLGPLHSNIHLDISLELIQFPVKVFDFILEEQTILLLIEVKV